jgi:8-oxo-dGTP pyrophosphatase MutT (NUDIX family)
MGTERGFMPGMERYFTLRAYSAGGVVFRQVPLCPPQSSFVTAVNELGLGISQGHRLGSIEVVLVGRSKSGIWALPKGTPQSGETIEQVAIREVQEETGLEVQLVAYIGSITYSFIRERIRYQKHVRHFLLQATGGDIALHDQEYDRVAWFSLPEALRHLTHINEANILCRAEKVLWHWLQYQEEM